MTDSNVNTRLATELVEQTRRRFLDHVVMIVDNVDAPVSVRRGSLGEKTVQDIRKGDKRDLRPLEMMTKSGKGGPGHEDSLNVTLFDHSLNVGLGAALMASVDLFGDLDENALSKMLSTIVAVGFAHDADKLFSLKWSDVSPETTAAFMSMWRLSDWLESEGIPLTVEQFHSLVQAVETRSAVNSPAPGILAGLYAACRTYVRHADRLESVFAKSWKPGGSGVLLKTWRDVRVGLRNPDRFGDFDAVVVTDPHHPFLLDALQRSIGGACLELVGYPPLFNVQQDATLLTLIPKKQREQIISDAIEDVISQLPFESGIFINPQGAVKATGRRLEWSNLRSTIRSSVLSSDGMRLLSVKNADVLKAQTDVLNANGMEIARLSAAAGCPSAKLSGKGAMAVVVRPPSENDDELDDTLRAATFAYLLGVQTSSKDKALSERSRENLVVETLGLSIPEWAELVQPVTRRTVVALLAANVARDKDLDLFSEDGPLGHLLGESGLAAGRGDKASLVIDEVREHFLRLLSGTVPIESKGTRRCIVTGTAVGDEWLVTAPDRLHGIKSSALSYREGRSEDRFREIADTHLSPVSYAEHRLRTVFEERRGGKPLDAVPVRLCSTTSAGMFGTQVTLNEKPSDISTYDALRGDRKKQTVSPLESYLSPMRIGRFEALPPRFVDRLQFVRRCLSVAQRLGRPIHVFQGLPVIRPEFFASDCLGREIESLLGGSGLRIEQIDDAIDCISIVEGVASPRSDGGLGEVTLAKAICHPNTAFEAACLAWWIADNSSNSPEDLARRIFNQTIPNEVKRMANDNKSPSILGLADIARTIQRRPMGGSNGDSNNWTLLLMRVAIEAAERAYAVGIRDLEGMIPEVGGAIEEETDRAHSSPSGFFSSAASRPEGATIPKQIDTFAKEFLQTVWFTRFGGRPATHVTKRSVYASYAYALRRSGTAPSV